MARLQSGTRIYGNAIIDTQLSIDGNTAATSNTTGALKVSGGVGVVGNVFSSGIIFGIEANLGNLVTANYLAGTLVTANQPNITNIGTLGNVVVTNNANVGTLNATNAVISGNLVVSGNTTYVNVTTLEIKDTIIEQGGGANGAALTVDDNKDRGTILHYYDGSAKQAFMGWDNSNSEFALGSNVTVSFDDQINFANLGNLRLDTLIGKVSGYANTVSDNAQPNITSVGTLSSLTVSGNLSSGNANLGNLAKANYFEGNGSLLTGVKTSIIENGTSNLRINGANANVTININGTSNIFDIGSSSTTMKGDFLPHTTETQDLGSSSKKWRDLYLAGNTIFLGNAQLQANNTTFKVANGNIEANYFKGDGSMLTNLPTGLACTFITSNVTNFTTGADLAVDATYGNAQYPGGVFTIYQLGPANLTATTQWASGSSSKNQYTNFLESIINTQNIRLNLNITNANFTIQSTDTINIGGSIITGANITSLGISGTGGIYTINSELVNANVQLNASSTVTANLTTSRGVKTASSTTLTTVAPVAYNVNSIAASFPQSSVPYFDINQSFNWNLSVTGTTQSGNLTYSTGAAQGVSLTSVGATSGTSTSIDSTISYTITTNDYTGAGLNGYGTRTIPNPVSGTVNAATIYYPLFWKITSTNARPTFTTSDNRNSNNYTTGQGANTSATTTDYLWIATPTSAQRTWGYTFIGSLVTQEPDVPGVQQTIAGQVYTVYGFTNFSAVTFLYTVT
jgi:hypothetical protein